MNTNQPISSAQALELIAAIVPEVATVELTPWWTDGLGGDAVRHTRAVLIAADGADIEVSGEQRFDVAEILRRVGDVDLSRPQTLTVATGTAELTFPVVLSLPEALGGPAAVLREALLAEQRHQVEDPAEPPLAVRTELPGGAA